MDNSTDDQSTSPIRSVDDLINNMSGPMTKRDLMAAASEADSHVRAQVEALPDQEYYHPQDVQAALQGNTTESSSDNSEEGS